MVQQQKAASCFTPGLTLPFLYRLIFTFAVTLVLFALVPGRCSSIIKVLSFNFFPFFSSVVAVRWPVVLGSCESPRHVGVAKPAR